MVGKLLCTRISTTLSCDFHSFRRSQWISLYIKFRYQIWY